MMHLTNTPFYRVRTVNGILSRTAIAPLMILSFVFLTSVTQAQSALDTQIAAFKKATGQRDEANVIKILNGGLKTHRSAEALAAVQRWLKINNLSSPQSVLVAAQSAEYAGEWQQAIGFYQRLLQEKGVDKKTAGIAVDATYRLLINALGDDNAAYLLMKKDGDRLRIFGNARRYDRWFLDKARGRRDLIAVCSRLVAISKSASASEFKRFSNDVDWVARDLEQFKKLPKAEYLSAQKLADAGKVSAAHKARLKWAVHVMKYNQQLDELRNSSAPADPKLTQEAIGVAAELLKASPDQGPFLVAAGWGTEYDHHRSGNCKKRYAIGGKDKLKQLVDHLPKMKPERRDDLLAFEIARGGARFDLSVTRKAVLDNPKVFNSLAAANVRLWDSKMSVQQAKKLAPLLVKNPHLDAALIRVKASGVGRRSEAMAQFVKTEAWRALRMSEVIYHIVRAGYEDDIDHKKLTQKYGQPVQPLKGIGKKTPSAERLKVFKKIQDNLTGTPSMQGALSAFDELLKNSTTSDREKIIKILLEDPKNADLFSRMAGTMGVGYRGRGRIKWRANVEAEYFTERRNYTRSAFKKFMPELETMLKRQSKSGKFSERAFGFWLHTVDCNNLKAQTLMKSFMKSPAYGKLSPGYRIAAADDFHFGALASPDGKVFTPGSVSRELLMLPKKASAAKVTSALKAAAKRVDESPEPVAIIGLHQVASLQKWSPEIRKIVLSLFAERAPIGAYPVKQGYEKLIVRLVEDLKKEKEPGYLDRYAAGLWRAAATKDHAKFPDAIALSRMAESFLKSHPSLATTYCRAALKGPISRTLFSQKDWDMPATAARIEGVNGKASLAIGAIDIPVDEKDPTYPIYRSQSEFALGNLGSSWNLFEDHAQLLLPERRAGQDEEPLIRKMSVGYCIWLLERCIEERDTKRAETLVKELMIWSRQASGTFSASQDAELKIAYADTALQNGNHQTARAWYRRVADAAEHKETELQYKAALRSVRVDRLTRNYSAALNELDKLMLIRDEGLRTRVHFARSEVLFDQEKYADAYEEVSLVLKSDPGHADGLILLGKAQLEMRKLVDASEIELGATRDQGLIVPGETIKINLNDPSLNVAGVGADIEVEIWAESGDRERVMLYQLGDDKSKYRAEVPTKLAAPNSGDKVLQVLGRDKIRYGYSKRFRAKMADLPPDPEITIEIASDAYLNVSAGAFPPRKGERRLNLEALGVSSAQKALGTRHVRPGNPVYVRVHDPDQSVTDGVDELVVSLSTGSGDAISALKLKETDTHSGIFEGIVPTTPAQALAFASESATGRDPNMAISARSYPGWTGQVGSKSKERIFGVDLNDNVELDKMKVSISEAAMVPTHFVLQTSMDGRSWRTRARFPDSEANRVIWDGRPQITSFPTYGTGIIQISSLDQEGRRPARGGKRGGGTRADGAAKNVPLDWVTAMETRSAGKGIRYAAMYMAGLNAFEKFEPASGGHPGYSTLIRYRALFYQPAAAIRTFKLTGFPLDGTRFLLDGTPAEADAESPLTIRRELQPGLHKIEIWRNGSRAEMMKRRPKLLCNAAGQADLVPCPDRMFDPNSFPRGVKESLSGAASVKLDGKKRLDVQFDSKTRARLIRFVILGQDGAVPGIHKVTLTDRSGNKRLPVATDYQQLRSNQELEVVPGDQIAIRYDDNRVVTQKKTRHEGRLGVAYNTAQISASFLNYETNKQGERQLVLEPIRRFNFDDAVAIVVNDADMDQSPERDQLTLRVTSSSGGKTTIQALETTGHSGVFVGRVFPVEVSPSRSAEIQVVEGGTLTAIYRDEENLRPGIPTDRQVTVEHAKYMNPVLALYDMRSERLPRPGKMTGDGKNKTQVEDENGPEIILPRQSLAYQYVEPAEGSVPTAGAFIGSTLRFDVVASHLAFAPSSSITAYVQTESGRKAFKGTMAGSFDVRVPGTMKITAKPSSSVGVEPPAGYVLRKSGAAPTTRPPLDEGRFAFSIPLILGDRPVESYATAAAETLLSSQLPDGLIVQPGDRIHVGYAYKDKQGKAQWRTATVSLSSHAILDVMNGRYRKTIHDAYVGEKLYLRLIAPGLNRGPERDKAFVNLKAGGTSARFELQETMANSGEFKGAFSLAYRSDPAGKAPAGTESLPPIALRGFPVRYGDRVQIAYQHVSGPKFEPPEQVMVNVNKGADGLIEPFSKRYTEDAMAIRTTFTLAECFFELAKYHRKMDQESLARREMGHAQKLLAEAIASHRDDELKAHAEYLLGNLAQEYADLSKNEAAKRAQYQDALARFSKIPLDYPEAEFAPKAQFKKGLVYERLGEMEIAVEEYVKLAYKYPEHELIPSVMSRLGAYFQSVGLALKKQAEALEQDKQNLEAMGEALKLREKMVEEYLNAAVIFSKLQSRFPNDPLAGMAGLRSAQNYMRAGSFATAIDAFKIVVDNESYDGKKIRSQAMYWTGLSQERLASQTRGGTHMKEAYETYRRVTFDFPDSVWAKYARGRLADPAFERIIEQENKLRERMLEALKEQR